MAKVYIDEEVEVSNPRNKNYFMDLILGNFDAWIAQQIEPTLQANREKYESQSNTKNTESGEIAS
jgi:hypothetical protein